MEVIPSKFLDRCAFFRLRPGSLQPGGGRRIAALGPKSVCPTRLWTCRILFGTGLVQGRPRVAEVETGRVKSGKFPLLLTGTVCFASWLVALCRFGQVLWSAWLPSFAAPRFRRADWPLKNPCSKGLSIFGGSFHPSNMVNHLVTCSGGKDPLLAKALDWPRLGRSHARPFAIFSMSHVSYTEGCQNPLRSSLDWRSRTSVSIHSGECLRFSST